MQFTVTKNIHGPGYHVRNPENKEVCWVFDQGRGTKELNKKRAVAIAELLTKIEPKAEGDCSPASCSAINVIFDGPPGPEAGRFVEVETDDGRSINVGEWVKRKDGYWALRISSLPNDQALPRGGEQKGNDHVQD